MSPWRSGINASKGQRSTQRKRLLAGLIAVANRDGYARASVSAIITEAGVSRPTFYEYFTDRDDCFLTAQRAAQEELLTDIRAALLEQPPERAMHAAIAALLQFTDRHATTARFLTNEPMGGGRAALDLRDAGIDETERLIEARQMQASSASAVPDFSPRMLIGGICRLLASRLRRGEPIPSAMLPDLLSWVDAYQRPLGRRRWSQLHAGLSPPQSPFVTTDPLRPPEAPPAGRTRTSEQNVAEGQRLRIMFAAARLAEQKGYNATTIGDITKAAAVDGRVFYAMFADKQEAFMAVHEFGFQRVMNVTATAFFSGATWPERNWEAGRAFTQFLDLNPLIANVGFVEAYAVGPGAVQRVEDSHTAFAMLLAEGYQHVGEQPGPSRLVLEAIITTIFETVYREARASDKRGLDRLVGHFSFLVLSPFMGTVEADEFIEEKFAGLTERRSRRTRPG